jgi:hypothetical protein
MSGPTVCETRWSKTLASFDKHHGGLVTAYPGAEEDISLIRAALVQIGSLIRSSPAKNGNGEAWKELTTKDEAEKVALCKHLEEKTLITAILRLYAATHREMMETLLQEVEDAPETKEEFREQRRRKRNSSDGQTTQAKKFSIGQSPDAKAEPRLRNFYAPLRDTMDLEVTGGVQQEPSSQAGRPPPIMLTSATNLLQLQKKPRSLVKGNFEFRTSRNGTRVVTREMADFSAIKAYFTSENLSFYTFFPPNPLNP